MRLIIAVAMTAALTAPGLAAAQLPQTETGARPGNEIGTGMSLPRSDKAGNLDAATTHSDLAPNLPTPAGAETVRDLLMASRQDLATKSDRRRARSLGASGNASAGSFDPGGH